MRKGGIVGKYPYFFLSFLLFWKQLLTDSHFLKETAHDLGPQGLWVYPSVRDGGGQLGKVYLRESDACPRPLRRSGGLAESPLLLFTCSSLRRPPEEEEEE